MQNLLNPGDAPPGTFAVLDPMSKKLFIPLESMIDTRAMHREGVPSLCRIYLEGRCRQGSNCFQAHAATDVIERLRAVALAEPTCCQGHGAPSDTSNTPPDLAVVFKNDAGELVLRTSLLQLTVTNGLRGMIATQVTAAGTSNPLKAPEVIVPVSSLCRMHSGVDGSRCCRFEGDCNFVHVCRELIPQLTCGPVSSPTKAVEVEVPAVGQPASPPIASPLKRPPPLCSSVSVPLSASACFVDTPPIRFETVNLACTAPIRPDGTVPMGVSPVLSRSFSSTPSGLVWRHNPYGSSRASSVLET